jgi:hypothetical protein
MIEATSPFQSPANIGQETESKPRGSEFRQMELERWSSVDESVGSWDPEPNTAASGCSRFRLGESGRGEFCYVLREMP